MRLTERNGTYVEHIFDNYKNVECYGQRTLNNELTHKLGQLEDIEEELGIDLITFYKIYAYGFYYKYKDEILYGLGYDNEINVASHKITTRYATLHFKDYGKTWALTKEELE